MHSITLKPGTVITLVDIESDGHGEFVRRIKVSGPQNHPHIGKEFVVERPSATALAKKLRLVGGLEVFA